jgi:hypothetical protein
MSNKPDTTTIDDVLYIRADSVAAEPMTHDGMPYVIVRSRDQGVMCGYLGDVQGRAVTLRQARQIWRYDSTFVLPDIAEHGMRDPSKAKLSVAMSQPMVMLEACGILTCTAKAANQLSGIEAVKR